MGTIQFIAKPYSSGNGHRNYQFDLSIKYYYISNMLFDLHVHTTVSPCSNLSMDQILSNAKRIGLDGVCITDHFQAGASVPSGGSYTENGLVVVMGTEYDTPQGDLLLFGPDLDLPGNLSAQDVLTRVEAMGGAAILAHPFRAKRPGDEKLVSHGMVAAVEEFNGRNTLDENLKVAGWLAKYPINAVAGSDAHSLAELGRAMTYFSRPIRGWQDLVAAIKAGDMAPLVNEKILQIASVPNNQLNCV